MTIEPIPLMWTDRGNVPVDSLRYEHEWVTEPQDNGNTILWFRERWYFDDGELAKNNAHGYVIPSADPPKLKPSDVTISLTGAGIGGQQAVMQ